MSKPAAIARVLVIDDHPVVIQGLRCWLKDAHVKAVWEARDVISGYRLFRRHHPDVVIIDLAVRGSVLSGLDVIRRMRAHNRRSCILVFTLQRNPAIAARALKAGATGYMLKDASPDEVIKALHQVRSGNRYLKRRSRNATRALGYWRGVKPPCRSEPAGVANALAAGERPSL